jgi:dienelactone hydrolase
MAEMLIFHHAHGLTDGMCALAERLRAAGHTVHTPDCYAGQVYADLDEGIRHAQTIGHDAVEDVARRAARKHSGADVVLGFSLGTTQAQLLAQDLRRIRGCLLMGGAQHPRSLGGFWRHNVDLQIHVADPDEWVNPEELAGLIYHAPHVDVFRYRDLGHMFVDPSSQDYDADGADLFEDRLDEWLARLDADAVVNARSARNQHV